MPITVDDIAGPDSTDQAPTDPEAAKRTASEQQRAEIVEWVDEIPKHRRANPFDPVVEQVRAFGDPAKSAKVTWGDKTITPNKVNQLRTRYPDCEFTQVTGPEGKNTYVRWRGPDTETQAVT